MDDRAPADDVELIRYYTAARRVPLTFGRLSDGMRIPGGPYSGMQMAAGAVGLVLGPILVAALMGEMPAVVRLALSILAAWGAAYGAGYLPSTFRNPLMVFSDAVRVLAQSGAGSYKGRRLVAPRKVRSATPRVSGVVPIIERTQPVVSAAPAQVVIPDVDERPRPFLQAQEDEHGIPVVTGLDRLRSLASEKKGSSR